jgi:hypothetical protein
MILFGQLMTVATSIPRKTLITPDDIRIFEDGEK